VYIDGENTGFLKRDFLVELTVGLAVSLRGVCLTGGEADLLLSILLKTLCYFLGVT